MRRDRRSIEWDFGKGCLRLERDGSECTIQITPPGRRPARFVLGPWLSCRVAAFLLASCDEGDGYVPLLRLVDGETASEEDPDGPDAA
jgi:hypothetical protein